MTVVNTVLGPVKSSELGLTLCHEHVISSSPDIRLTFPKVIDRKATIEKAIRDLTIAKSDGLQTIMDPTTHDQGRDIEALIEVSDKTGINIIICTGTWLDVPRLFWETDPELVAELYINEIEKGIEDTGVKAGFIKVATDVGGITPPQEIVLRAAARAQKRTGIPILTHTFAAERIGDQQIKILNNESADMNLVSIGHSSDTTDMEYLEGILQSGAWLGMDRNPEGIPGTATPSERVQTVKTLIDLGWGHRVMLGHDWDSNVIPHRQQQRIERESKNPDSYSYITRKFIPELHNLGSDANDTKKLLVDNPRKFFENP
ncbi:MAG: phosphotriesterase-related protein [Chloroflexota bacterium]|nr:phosphotriesterase-related protein [Chloroflexota bacterium]